MHPPLHYLLDKYKDFSTKDPETRVVFVSIDCAMMGQLVKLFVLEELESLYPGVYNEANVVLSSTHTHSGPAGKNMISILFLF